MAFKRQVGRLPIIPADAQEFNVTCHYCIVGGGHKACTWPMNRRQAGADFLKIRARQLHPGPGKPTFRQSAAKARVPPSA